MPAASAPVAAAPTAAAADEPTEASRYEHPSQLAR